MTTEFPVKGDQLLKLKDFINKKISNKGDQDYLLMYQQAVSENSSAMRYLLFYKLLETICRGRKRTEEFIKSQLPSIEICKDRRGDVTVLTWVRDNIHSKNAGFPYK